MTDEMPIAPAEETQGEQSVLEPSPQKDVGWKDFLTAIGIIWAVEVFLGILTAVIMLAASGFQPHAMTPRMEYVLPTLVLSWLATLTVIWYFACRKYRHSIRRGFAVRAIPWKTAGHCVILGVITAIIAGTLMYFFANGKGYIVDLAVQKSEEGGEPTLSPLFLLMTILVPPFEEFYYRGFVYPTLRRLTGVPVAFGIIVLWFGLIHTPQLFGDWAGIAVVTVMGAVFTYLRQRYDSILPSVITHFTYNGALMVVGIVSSAFE